jgi:hypothetical protein
MPEALLAVNETMPLKPETPATLIVVEGSLVPRETVTMDLLRETLKSAGVMANEKVVEWLNSGIGGVKIP